LGKEVFKMKGRRKRRAKIFFTVALNVALICFGAISQLEAKGITLRFATYHSPIGPEGEGPKWLMEEITKRTDGEVKFEQYFAGSLLNARELLKGIQSGTADMGYIFTPYFPRELVMNSILQTFIRAELSPETVAPTAPI
jgi:TRAP-type C4-dicarboxylate transport system substrate-binding protein